MTLNLLEGSWISAVEEKVFSEVHRVLAAEGKFLIWDVLFPPRVDDVKDRAIFFLNVNLPDEEIETGYGVPWPVKGRELTHYLDIALTAGFDVLESRQDEKQFFIKLQKL